MKFRNLLTFWIDQTLKNDSKVDNKRNWSVILNFKVVAFFLFIFHVSIKRLLFCAEN